MRNYIKELEDRMINILGYEKLCEELIRAMGYEQEIDLLKFIARMHDIEISDLQEDNNYDD